MIFRFRGEKSGGNPRWTKLTSDNTIATASFITDSPNNIASRFGSTFRSENHNIFPEKKLKVAYP